MKNAMLALALLCASVLYAAPVSAAPIVIGSIYFADNSPLGGAVVVENLSDAAGVPDDFGEIVVELQLAGGGSEIYGYGQVGVLAPSFVLGGPWDPTFTFSSLTFTPGLNTAALDLPDPALYTSASLRLMFRTTFVDNAAPVAIRANATSPVTIGAVPEPAALLLVGAGAAVAALRRRVRA